MPELSFSIDFSQIRRIARQYQGADRVVMNELTTAMARSAEHARQAANSLIRHKTGRLARETDVRTNVFARRIEGIVRWLAPYAKWVAYGRGPVVAKRAKALRFEIDGVIFFRKRVGPAPAQRFNERGLARAIPAIEGEFRAAMARIARWAQGGP
jgi:hypothetical protein